MRARLRPRSRLKAVVTRWMRRGMSALGYETIPRDNHYSPVPRPPEAGAPFWDRPAAKLGFPLDLDEQVAFARRDLAPYLSELALPWRPDPAAGALHLDNPFYRAGDIELLYAILRWAKPSRILELGSGFSTLVSARAVAANAQQGSACELVAVDPFPQATLNPASVDGLHSVEQRDVLDLRADRYAALEAGDVLFVDTCHVVRLGGELNHLVLDVLPTLAPGVIVHFHDIFLPYEYPRFLVDMGLWFTEQYLLRAYLAGNADYRVLIGAQALWRERRDELQALVPALRDSEPVGPSAFWLVRA